jgi:hypothetical protein
MHGVPETFRFAKLKGRNLKVKGALESGASP